MLQGLLLGGRSCHPLTCHAHVRIIYTQYFLFQLSILVIEVIDFPARNQQKEQGIRISSILKKSIAIWAKSTPFFCWGSSRLAASAVIHQKQMSVRLVWSVLRLVWFVLHGSCKYVHLIALNLGPPVQPPFVFGLRSKCCANISLWSSQNGLLFPFRTVFDWRALLPGYLADLVHFYFDGSTPLNCKLITQSKHSDIWAHN